MAQASEQVVAGMQSVRKTFYIGGKWVEPATDKRFNLVNASTEESLGSVPEGVEADMDRAVAAAREAFDDSSWAQTSGAERAAIMNRFADELEKRAPEIAATISSQNGMPISLSQQFEAGFPILMLRYYAGLAENMEAEEQRTSLIGQKSIVQRTPIGVAAGIVPWNFPATLAMSKIAPAMAAGCTLVLKPSPGTALDWYLVAEAAAQAGVPAGVLNWVPGDRAAGAHLVAHPGVDKVAFTGSTAAGRKVAQVCGEALRPVTLELGGKSAGIVLDDADLDVTIPGLQFASLMNNGQTCLASTRILAPESRYNEVVDALAEMANGLAVGDAMDEATQCGPMASAEHRDRVMGYVERGKQEARCVVGGGKPGGLDRGWFVAPTIFADVDNNA
ncbi:MAG: aldehyde dehydrogenase family protein, partial [Salinisphaera sp.]|nr:aldehyde dehydrogenase family protein [Salinisphaera sp.]